MIQKGKRGQEGDVKIHPMVHDLKVWPMYFEPLIKGIKTFELRKADRDFQVWDFLDLREWDPVKVEYTGRECSAAVIYILDGPMAIEGMCLMGLHLVRDKSMRTYSREVLEEFKNVIQYGMDCQRIFEAKGML